MGSVYSHGSLSVLGGHGLVSRKFYTPFDFRYHDMSAKHLSRHRPVLPTLDSRKAKAREWVIFFY